MKITHIKNDLFRLRDKAVLAHAIAQDGRMGAGIAKTFSQKYPTIKKDVTSQKPRVGSACKTIYDDAVVYNLVTKPLSHLKPINHDTMACALQDLRDQMSENNESELAIPLIGAGLDGLDWETTQELLVFVFQNTDINITVCHLDKPVGYTDVELFKPEPKGYRLAITGHRPQDFKAGYNMNHIDYDKLRAELTTTVKERLTQHETVVLISGLALGVDTLYGQVAESLKAEYGSRVQFEAHVPMKSQSVRWRKENKAEYQELLALADKVVYYASEYSPQAMMIRNIGMISNCDELIACYSGKETGGTAQAIKYAQQKNKKITYSSTEYFK